MENTAEKRGSGHAPSSEGAAPIAKAQGEETGVKEGDASQQRPEHGSDGGPNTGTREEQLPSLEGAGGSGRKGSRSDEQAGSDADTNHKGNPSV